MSTVAQAREFRPAGKEGTSRQLCRRLNVNVDTLVSAEVEGGAAMFLIVGFPFG